jgi:hypothetical protein
MIYLAFDPRTRLTKIGFSDNPEIRVLELSNEITTLPEPLGFRLIATFPGTRSAEIGLHFELAERRIRGEWFDICDGIFQQLLAGKITGFSVTGCDCFGCITK